MKIAAAGLQMASSHVATQRHEVKESLRMWVGAQRPDFERRDDNNPVKISSAAQSALSAEAAGATKATDDEQNQDPKVALIKAVLEFMLGRKVKVFDASQLQAPAGEASGTAAGTRGGNPSAPTAPQSAGYGVEYDRHEIYAESEQTSFAAEGTVRTADGREIAFSVDIAMQRSYSEETTSSLRLGDAVRPKDPLVLNFSGTATQLTDTRFSFDIDADGHADQINFVGPGSGFLVFDRNRDGTINDGSELFGPASGDGFSELSALDGDGNGWIDENDAVFNDLGVWSKDAAGKDYLQSLAAANVGAISLQHVTSPFAIKDDANGLKGQIRSSGVFLQESGEAGTIQQLDLTA